MYKLIQYWCCYNGTKEGDAPHFMIRTVPPRPGQYPLNYYSEISHDGKEQKLYIKIKDKGCGKHPASKVAIYLV